MYPREISKEFRTLLKEFPVVTILGPRQSGKTTLARHTLRNYAYANIEDPQTRTFASEDPKGFLRSFKGKRLILDEIQRAPQLLSDIQVIVDETKINGQFVLTGSQQFELHQGITQSLAGRTGILTLLPLSISELDKGGIRFETFHDYAFRGFLPRVHDQNQRPFSAYSAYYKTYIERDLRQIINIKNIGLFEKFMKLLAGRVGQLLDYNSLANDVGTSAPTIKTWISVLEASFILFRLNPYFENFGKRVIKAPKYYFTEIGLLIYLLEIEKVEQIRRDPLIGAIFENLVVIECLKSRLNQGKSSNLYFFRDSNHVEVDLMFKSGTQIHAVEIKSAETFHPYLAKNIVKVKGWMNNCKPIVIYSGKTYRFQDTQLLNFVDAYKAITPQ